MVERFERYSRDRLCRLESALRAVELTPEIHVAASSLQIQCSNAWKRSFDLIHDFAWPIAAYGAQIRFHVRRAVRMEIHGGGQRPALERIRPQDADSLVHRSIVAGAIEGHAGEFAVADGKAGGFTLTPGFEDCGGGLGLDCKGLVRTPYFQSQTVGLSPASPRCLARRGSRRFGIPAVGASGSRGDLRI